MSDPQKRSQLIAQIPPHFAALAGVVVSVLYCSTIAVLGWLPVTDIVFFPVALWIVFALLARCDVRTRTILLHAVSQILVLTWVFHIWQVGYEGRNAIFGGILPWSDSYGYYNGAERVVHGFQMLWASKRPLFPATLAVLLKFFDGDLRAALLLFALFSAWSVALAGSEIWKTHGRRAAFLFYGLIMLCERVYAGYVQTEHIGLPFGLIGFVLVWRAAGLAETKPGVARWFLLSGLFSITVGLMARAGEFFVLPAIALWGARYLVNDGATNWARLRFLGLAASAMLAGYLVNTAAHYSTSAETTFEDYPMIAYGLIHHQDYTYITDTHPYLKALPPNDLNRAEWHILLQESASQPSLVLSGLSRSFAYFFISREGLFGFIWHNPDDAILENLAPFGTSISEHGLIGPILFWVRTQGIFSLVNAVAMFLLAITFVIGTAFGIFLLYRGRPDPYLTLLRYTTAGILISAPFTPPWVAPAQRIAVVTLPFIACITAVALVGRRQKHPQEVAPNLAYLPFGLTAAMLCALLFVRLSPAAMPICSSSTVHPVELFPSTAVRVTSSRSFDLNQKALPDLIYSLRFLKRHFPWFMQSLAPYLKPGTLYVAGFDACDANTKVFVDDSYSLDLKHRGWQPMVGHRLSETNVVHVRPLPTKVPNIDGGTSAQSL